MTPQFPRVFCRFGKSYSRGNKGLTNLTGGGGAGGGSDKNFWIHRGGGGGGDSDKTKLFGFTVRKCTIKIILEKNKIKIFDLSMLLAPEPPSADKQVKTKNFRNNDRNILVNHGFNNPHNKSGIIRKILLYSVVIL